MPSRVLALGREVRRAWRSSNSWKSKAFASANQLPAAKCAVAALTAMENGNADAKMAGARLAGVIGRPCSRVSDRLRQLLTDHDQNVRRAAAISLVRLGQAGPATEELVSQVSAAQAGELRDELLVEVAGLGFQLTPAVAQALEAAATSGDPWAKDRVAQALEELRLF